MTSDRSKLRRRLFMEPLEDRRMLAIAGDLTGALLQFTGDAAANDLSVVNVVGSTYVISSATDNITITDNDHTLTLVGNGTPAVTVTAPPGAVNNLSIDLAGSGDTVSLAGLTAAASNGLKSLTVSDTGAAGTDTVRLAGDVAIDGDFKLIGVENLLLTASATIDTEQGNDSNSGNVNFGGAVTSANAAGLDLSIDATTGGAFTAGIATLGAFSNAPGPQFVHNLTISGPSMTVITADMHTSGDQVFNGDAQLAADATLTATNVVFSGKLDDDSSAATPSNLTINTTGSGLTSFAGTVGGISPLTSITTNADGSTLIDDNIHTTGDQIYNDPVTLGGDATLVANNVTFASTLDDDGNAATTSNLTINTGGVTTFAGAVGGITPLTSLTTDAPGSTAINGGGVTTSGSQTYNDAVTLGAATVLTSTGSGNIKLASTVDGPFTLTVNTAGTTTFGGAVGGTTALASVTTDAPGTTAINGGSVTTTGAQTYNDAVLLGADTVFTSTGSGNITFASTLDGTVAFNVTVNTAGITTFGGALGSVGTVLGSVTTDAAGSTAINGSTISTSGAQTFNDAVTLGAATHLSITANGAITFGNTLNGAFTLIVDTSRSLTFGGAVGGTTALVSVRSNAGQKNELNGGSVITTGLQFYQSRVELGANTVLTSTGGGEITLHSDGDGAFSLAVNTAGNTTFQGLFGFNSPLTSVTTDAPGSSSIGGIITTGAQTYNDPVILNGDGAFARSNAAGNVTFASTVDGVLFNPAFSLSVQTAGVTTFGGAVGGAVPLASVTTDAAGSTAINGGSVKTTGSQTYNDAVTLGANTVLTSTGGGNITLASTVNGGFSLAVNTTGTTTFGGAVGGTTALTSLTTDAGGSTAINGGSVTTTGAQTYNDAVTLAANTVLTSTGAGNVTLANTVNGPFTLTVNTAGVTTFGGATALTSVTTDAPGTTAINGGSVTTTGAQAYNDAVTIGANTALTSTGAGNITLGGTVNGAFTLTVNTAGTTTFGGAVGNATPLTSVTTDAPGSTALNGGAVTTTGAQTYNDAVTLGTDTLLTSTGAGNITLANTVNGPFTLTVNTAGVTTFGGAVGGTTALTSVTTDAPGTTAINGGSVTTTGSQTYHDAVTLGANAVLTSTGGANITLGNTVNGAFSLTVNTTGTTTFSGPVGNTTALTSVTTNPGGTTALNGGSITTTGAQTYNDAVILGADAALTSTGAGNITFANTIDGAFALTVNTAGTTTFGGIVGGATGLAALTTNAGGTTHINTTAIGASVQTYNDDVILGSNTRLGSSVSTTFNGTVDGPFDLDIFSIGTATFNKPLGGTTPLANIIFEANINRINANVTGTGNVSLLNQVFVQNTTTHLVTIAGNFVQFLNFSSLNGAVAGESLTVVAAAGVPLNGVVGNTQPLQNLTVIANDGTISAAGNIITTGAIFFTATETLDQPNNITVASGVTVHSTGSFIEFDAGDDIHLNGTATLIAATNVTLKVDVGNADLGIGQNLTIDTTATIVTAAGAFLVGGSDNDTISFASLPGTMFDVKAGAGNDTITVINKNPDGTARLITIDGQTDNPTELATIRQGGANASKRPYFLPTAVAVSVADKVFWDDTAATHFVGLPTGNIYHLTGGAMIRNGNMELNYANIELLNLKTGQGNDDVTADMTAGPLPNIVQINDAGGFDNRFQVEGSAAGDNISIGDIGTTLITSGGPLRASFELAGFQRQWVRGNGGNDVIDNISKVPGILDGGANDDTINSIVNVANSRLTIRRNVLNSTINNVTLVLGNLGHDHLYVGSGAVDGPLVAGSVAAALKAFPDRSITFLIGDYKANATGNKLVQVVAGGEAGDTYSSSSSAFQHGFVALKDTTPSRGIFKFGAGDTIRFSSTIAWLKAQIFVKAALNQLVNGPLSRQLAAYTKVVGPTAEGEAADFDTFDDFDVLDDSTGDLADDSEMLLSATTDVNRDGLITPIDALLVINDLNARGSRQLPPPPAAEGEDSLDDSTDPQPMFDVNGDGFLSPADALSVINTLNMLAADNTSPDGEYMGDDTGDDTAAAVDTLMQVPATTTPPASSSSTTISDALMALMALDSQTANRKKSP